MGYPVIFQIEDVYYPVLAAVGVPVNLVAIVILFRGKCGLSKCISVYLVGMAVADLLVVITDPILRWIVPIYFPVSFLDITPVCSIIKSLGVATAVVSVWLTVAFTFDRFVAICCEKLKTKYCTEKMAAVVLGTVSALGCLESIPWYFTLKPEYIFNNVPWGCATKLSFRTSSAWATFDLFHRILTPCVPFFLILLLNILTVKRILAASRVRRGLRGRSNGEHQKDPEMENRKKSIILLFSISGSFILLWVGQVVNNIYLRITDVQYYSSYSDPLFIIAHTAKILQLLSSCTNTCIYVLTQSKFREELKNVVKYPLILVKARSSGCRKRQKLRMGTSVKTNREQGYQLLCGTLSNAFIIEMYFIPSSTLPVTSSENSNKILQNPVDLTSPTEEHYHRIFAHAVRWPSGKASVS
ncbi:probable G-protein coupled receptor 139 [Heptranchias perlo]|uniref:probable G-protein coupled receptor 139 n=1 Tax=Heptranchias perlo TaxID=212740 RepID=UPI00355A2DBC